MIEFNVMDVILHLLLGQDISAVSVKTLTTAQNVKKKDLMITHS
jgi:hypothetical protein